MDFLGDNTSANLSELAANLSELAANDLEIPDVPVFGWLVSGFMMECVERRVVYLFDCAFNFHKKTGLFNLSTCSNAILVEDIGKRAC